MANENELPPYLTQPEKTMKVLAVETKLAKELIDFYGPDGIVEVFDPKVHAPLLEGVSDASDELPELPS